MASPRTFPHVLRSMSSTEGSTNSAAVPAHHGNDVRRLVENEESSHTGKHVKNGKGKNRHEAGKEQSVDSFQTVIQLPNPTREGQNKLGDVYNGCAGKQDKVSTLKNKAQEQSSSPSSTLLDQETQGMSTSSVASQNPTVYPLHDGRLIHKAFTAPGVPAPVARVPLNEATSLLPPQDIDRHDRATSSALRTSMDGDIENKEPETAEGQVDGGATFEIQSIMDQFEEGGDGPDEEEVMSPRLELAGALLGNPVQHPPRKSSLEPSKTASPTIEQSLLEKFPLSPPSNDASYLGPENSSPGSSVKSYSMRSSSLPQSARYAANDGLVPQSPLSLHKSLPPEPDPEPDLPFDFHRFLEQLRHRTADPVAKFLRSFLVEFGKKQWMVHEQVKIISDFLAFIANKMAQCEVWRDVSDAEFDNAKEGMEKLVMNRLYSQTFSPAIPPPPPLPRVHGKRKNMEKLLGPGRRGQHQEDIERDEILEQKVRIYGWVQEVHLDIPPVGDSGRRFLFLAQQGMDWRLYI